MKQTIKLTEEQKKINLRKANKKWREANKEKQRKYQHERDKSEKAKAYRREYSKKYHQRDDIKDRRKELSKQSHRMEYQRQWKKQDHLNKPHLYRWRDLLTRTINKLKISKDDTTETLLGYSSMILLEYLSSIDENWTQYHIDHKIPITWFKQTTPISVVNDLRNLQLLTEDDNMNKSNRYAHPVPEEYYNIVLEYILPEYRSSLK